MLVLSTVKCYLVHKQIQCSSIMTNMLFARIKILSKTTEGAQRVHQLRPRCIKTVTSRNQW